MKDSDILLGKSIVFKSLPGNRYIQSAVLRERQQGEKRYCPSYGTGDNQRFRSPVQLQADYRQRAMGRQGQPGEREEQGSAGDQSRP